jgi:hypothetical protein
MQYTRVPNTHIACVLASFCNETVISLDSIKITGSCAAVTIAGAAATTGNCTGCASCG